MLITWHSNGGENPQDLFKRTSKKDVEAPLGSRKTPKVPPSMRRRLTSLGRLVVETLSKANDHLDTTGLSANIPWVMSSRHGDAERVGRLLTDVSCREMLSPMDFSQSVHNAIVGAFSIITKNTAPHTATSSGLQSFEMGLLEAYALQKSTGGYVGYAYYDGAMPEPYNMIIPGNTETQNICLVMILGPDQVPHTNSIRLTYSPGASHKNISLSPLNTTMSVLNQAVTEGFIDISGGHFSLELLV